MAGGWQKILKITIFGGFLDGQEIEFSPHLNCLIGGRGTGKSAVVELLRFALDCWPENRELKKRSQEHIEAVLGSGSVTVTVQSPEGSIYKIKRQLGYKPRVLDNKGQPTGLEVNKNFNFPLVVFSQGELELMGNNPAARLALLDGMIAERKKYINAINKLRLQLEKIRPEAAVLEQEIQNLINKTSLIPGLKERLKELESYDLDGLMARREQREKEIFWMRELYRGAQKKQTQLKNKLMERCLSFPGDCSNWVNADLMERALLIFDQTMEKQREQFNLLIQQWKKLQDELKTIMEELTERHRNEEEQDRPVMAKFYGQKLAKAMEERREYTSTLLELEKEAAQLEEKKEQLKKLFRKRDEYLGKLQSLEEQFFNLRKKAAQRVSDLLGDKLRVTVHHKKHNYRYYNFLSGIMADSGLRYTRAAEDICSSIPPWELSHIIRKKESFRLVVLAGLEQNRAEKILNILNKMLPPEKLLQLEEVPLIDWVELELLDGLKWKPSHMLSKGQICTAVLPLLLLDSEQPLIIDQPEDHLDNAYIYSTVVPALNSIKMSRQIILATHNANIPVLGRAENNTVLDSNGQRGWVNASGGLDDQGVLELLELLLEGGHEALSERLNTYSGRETK